MALGTRFAVDPARGGGVSADVAEGPAAVAWRDARVQTLLALAVLLAGVLALYLPPAILSGSSTLAGLDYWQLHFHRLRYAREALWGAPAHLPAWFTRELLGTPFWSNIQSFPWIPTRLILLFFDPTIAYVVAVNLAALLAAWFTYAFARSVGIGQVAAAMGGWTFAAAGFFAARVLAGHLTLLEAYPGLPLLLWRATVVLEEVPRHRVDWALFTLGLATACVVAAGHPQLPLYAVVTTMLYIVWQRPDRVGVRACVAMLLGVGCTLGVWWPMLELIGRSTRVLPLAPASSSIPFSYGRLGSFLFPWKDGWPHTVERYPVVEFTGYPSDAYFWDTVCYVGWLPLLAVPFVLGMALWRRQAVPRTWGFLAGIGLLACVSALPFSQQLLGGVQATLLRSPARQLYVTTFALALTVSFAADMLLRGPAFERRAWRWAIIGLLCVVHAGDLWRHTRPFIRLWPRQLTTLPSVTKVLARTGDGRVAVDFTLRLDFNRSLDDVGVFDAIMLARPYRALLDLTQGPPDFNTEYLRGSELSARALSFTGTRFVATTRMVRNDLVSLGASGKLRVYAVPDPLPRAAFVRLGSVQFMSEEVMHERLRNPATDLRTALMLPVEARAAVQGFRTPPANDLPQMAAQVAYHRPGPDEIAITVDAPLGGFVRVLEAWDPGWSATLDAARATVFPANTFVMAVPVDAGHHVVRLRFSTPGAGTGLVLSLMSAGALVLLSSRSLSRRLRPTGSASAGLVTAAGWDVPDPEPPARGQSPLRLCGR